MQNLPARSVRAIRRGINGYAASILLATLFATSYGWISWHTELEREARFMQSLADVTAKSLDSYFVTIGARLALLGTELSGRDGGFDSASAQPAFERFTKVNVSVGRIVVYTLDGKILASSGAAGRAGPGLSSLATIPSFEDARSSFLAGANDAVGRPFYGALSQEWILPVRHAVRDPAGTVRFVLGAAIPLLSTQEFWNDAPLPPGAAIGLIRDDGFLISRFPVPASRSLADLYANPVKGVLAQYLPTHPESGGGWLVGGSTVTGKRTVFAYRRLSHYPIALFINDPEENVWAAWWGTAKFFFMLLGTFLLLSLAGVRWARGRQALWEADKDRYIGDLEAANEELKAFSYSISHDLKSPVRAIGGFAQLLPAALGTLSEEGARLLGRIRENAARMDMLIDGLLDFSQMSTQALTIERIDVHELVGSILQASESGGRTIQWKVGDLPECLGDRVLVRQVWENLVSNAVKYSATRTDPAIEIGFREGAYFVSDNGVGFAMDYAGKLFSVFSRLHAESQFPGTGVGLAIVRRIVERHGGRAWAVGEEGKGASFFFTLPGPG